MTTCTFLNMTREPECVCPRFCEHFDRCMNDFIINSGIPSSRRGRVRAKLHKKNESSKCDFSGECASCQFGQCSIDIFIKDKITDYKPKIRVEEYEHPVHGKITSLISKSKSKNVRKKRYILYKYGCCQNCGSKENLTIDHIVEISKGGSLKKNDNLTVLCSSCNNLKSNPKKNTEP